MKHTHTQRKNKMKIKRIKKIMKLLQLQQRIIKIVFCFYFIIESFMFFVLFNLKIKKVSTLHYKNYEATSIYINKV